MSLRDDFLEDVHIGTNVNIVYELSRTTKVSGKVFAISETSVKIQTRDNRKISIAIESIIAYEELNNDLGNLQENNNKADSQVLVCNEIPDTSGVKENITPKKRKHDCYYTDYDDISCSESPGQRGYRDYGGYEEDEGRARYVCGSCPSCSYWDDFYGCHNGNEPGDRCTDADVW